ncbi:hypothetical protein [Pseudaestuariivita atlantica]|uniref:Uncharacterized protein n=1 Tax=Pseudaestuariivita atlantica TaxID=1317121 RepID=A0A0L1JTQ4_9RHOB|nr:hypothetical protein [Pseudaestuariivita atlantica]KNG95154.1 hypothetical protein ATO11_00425 [Pseudaestuariivita atlantica]
MVLIAAFMVLVSVGACVYFAWAYGIVRFHYDVMALLTATLVFLSLSILGGGGWFSTAMRAGSALSLITAFVISAETVLNALRYHLDQRRDDADLMDDEAEA